MTCESGRVLINGKVANLPRMLKLVYIGNTVGSQYYKIELHPHGSCYQGRNKRTICSADIKDNEKAGLSRLFYHIFITHYYLLLHMSS